MTHLSQAFLPEMKILGVLTMVRINFFVQNVLWVQVLAHTTGGHFLCLISPSFQQRGLLLMSISDLMFGYCVEDIAWICATSATRPGLISYLTIITLSLLMCVV